MMFERNRNLDGPDLRKRWRLDEVAKTPRFLKLHAETLRRAADREPDDSKSKEWLEALAQAAERKAANV